MPVHVQLSNGLPQCQGWLDKFSVGRGFFSTKNWQRRYIILTREGLGYTHHAPAQKQNNNNNINNNIKPSEARCFVPFEGTRKKLGGVRLRPVYLLRNVASFMHPEIPARGEEDQFTHLQIQHEEEEEDHERKEHYYYFALSFEEGRKRYFLLLRTSILEDYIIWTSALAAFVPAGSINTVVPIPHPLEVHHYNNNNNNNNININNINNNKNSSISSLTVYFRRKPTHRPRAEVEFDCLYVKDPDPCTPQELKKINKRVLEWDEGEGARWWRHFNAGRSIATAMRRLRERHEEEWVKVLCATSEVEETIESAGEDSTETVEL